MTIEKLTPDEVEQLGTDKLAAHTYHNRLLLARSEALAIAEVLDNTSYTKLVPTESMLSDLREVESRLAAIKKWYLKGLAGQS